MRLRGLLKVEFGLSAFRAWSLYGFLRPMERDRHTRLDHLGVRGVSDAFANV